MRGLKKKRRIQIIAAATVALVVATVMIGFAMRDGINFFRAPSDVVASPPPANEIFRIGGLVTEGSLSQGNDTTVRFSVTDGGATVPVEYSGVLPDLFTEGQGMIGEGTYVDGVFLATEILAKHDETYMPKEVADALKAQGVYQDPDAAVGTN
jgi:cytochrome c-type biogenesis protein CcmE